MLNTVLLLTAPGVSAIAVIRIGGPLVGSFLETHFRGALRAGSPVHGRLMDGERELDDPLVIGDPARQTADICTHGGRWVVHSVIELAKREGFAQLQKDEALPASAVDAEDVLEQEILQYLPLARTREAIQTLLNQRESWQNLLSEIFHLQSRISNLRSHIPHGSLSQILADPSLHSLLHPPRITIIGIPNAGKSTLANALLGKQHSIVSDTPGTTRDYVEDLVVLSGLAVYLVDTPGLRISEDQVEMAAIGISMAQIEGADLQILLLDPTQPADLQRELMAAYPRAMRVQGKCDITGVAQFEGQTSALTISAATGKGLPVLDLAIRRHFDCDELPHKRPCAWTQRQQAWIRDHLTAQ